jgi:hypothetical protein
VTSKINEPTKAEIREAAMMIRKAREHAGIIVVSAKDSEFSSPPTQVITEAFSNERFAPDCTITWAGVLNACFEWEPGVRGVELRDDEYQMISEVKLA